LKCATTFLDGNGGLYAAIRPLLPKLKSRGVKYFHIYCVDNILCRIADPHLIGCAIDMNADCAATVGFESYNSILQSEPKKDRTFAFLW
jgi:UDP-N-acetylglucosamine/UDP-N-acetylgalactosamine diphosphorylase